jgi:hypothetical protein
MHLGARAITATVTCLGLLGAGAGLAGARAAGTSTYGGTFQFFPTATATDSRGDVYVAQAFGEIDKISPAGKVSVVATGLDEVLGLAVDPVGTVYFSNGKRVERIVAGKGKIVATGFEEAAGLAVDTEGDVLVADAKADVVKSIAADGTVSIVAGSGIDDAPTPGPATASPLDGPSSVAVDRAGNLYIADSGNHEIEKVTTDGTLSIFAGHNNKDGTPTPGPATESRLSGLDGLTVDAAGDVYVVSLEDDALVSDAEEITYSGGIYKIDTTGVLSLVAGAVDSRKEPGIVVSGSATARPLDADGPSLDAAGNLYFANLAGGLDGVIQKVTPAGHMTLFAGKGEILWWTKPRIKGTYAVGRTVTVSKGLWTAPSVTEHYQWYASGARIKGATRPHLRLTSALRHRTITVKVTVSKPGYRSVTLTVQGKTVG